jgi:hypothetical protein
MGTGRNFGRKTLKEGDNFEDLDVGRGIIFKWVLKKWYMKMLIEFVCLRIGISGRLL